MTVKRAILAMLALLLLPGLALAQTQTRATFTVSKDFTDDNNAAVEVTLSCNNGLPLEQSQNITEGSPVEFVLTGFTDGTPTCEVTETTPTGYVAALAGSGTDGTCLFEQVADATANACRVTNTPGEVEIVVTKEWVIPNSGNEVNQDWNVTLVCEGQANQFGGGSGDDEFTFTVTPDIDGFLCDVNETVFDSSIEVTNGCQDLEIGIGQGAECTITNTVFFEGIPTLNQYGLALLALLMLGVGFVGFRRFV